MWNRQLIGLMAGTVTYVSGTPVPNATVTEPLVEPSWGPQPTGRGTFGILVSSIITLTMCVWTVLHLNVVPGRTTQKVRDKLGFVIVGVLAPELVLVIALIGFFEAKQNYKEYCKLSGCIPGGEEDLGMEGAFFISMGGFCLRTCGEHFNTTLTPSGFLYFAEKGIMQSNFTTRGVIVDKGEADMFAKFLVCVQAVWLVLQCAIRKAAGLPVTLLELHIVMHVLCTVVMFACWMRKPLGVCEQIPVTTDVGLASLLTVHYGQCQLEKLRIGYPTITKKADSIRGSTRDNVELPEPLGDDQGIFLLEEGNPTRKPVNQLIRRIHFLRQMDSTITKRGPFRSEPYRFTKSEYLSKEEYTGDIVVGPGDTLMIGKEISIQCNITQPGDGTIKLQRADIEILRLAATAIRTGKYPHLLKDTSDKGLLAKHKGNLDSPSLAEVQSLCMLAVSVLLLLLYGACHAAAWNTHFPTPAECWLWRISSIIVGIIPAGSIIVAVVKDDVFEAVEWFMRLVTTKKLQKKFRYLRKEYFCTGWSRVHELWTNPSQMKRLPHLRLAMCRTLTVTLTYLWVFSILFIGFALGLALVGARVFLVLESFLSLRSLPAGSFKTTVWGDYWPHF